MTNSTKEFFLEDPWALISEPCYPAGRQLYLHDERFWVSMDEKRQLLFFVQDSGGDSIKPLENVDGLNVTIERWTNGESRLVCTLIAAEADLFGKFATVAKDIAFHCSAFRGRQLFLKTQERIKSWANFLKPSRSGLSNAEFIGFFGELYVLSELLTPVVSAVDAVRGWIGTEGKKQDFALDDYAIEVKTTIAGESQTIKISSLDQLDRVTQKLYLFRVIASPAGCGVGLSLGALYQRCLKGVEHDMLVSNMFLQKASALYGKASNSQIRDMFKIASIVIFDVLDSFPKLTRSDVNPAILSCNYEISIASLESYKITVDLNEFLRNG